MDVLAAFGGTLPEDHFGSMFVSMVAGVFLAAYLLDHGCGFASEAAPWCVG